MKKQLLNFEYICMLMQHACLAMYIDVPVFDHTAVKGKTHENQGLHYLKTKNN